jgi:hypothetical protein
VDESGEKTLIPDDNTNPDFLENGKCKHCGNVWQKQVKHKILVGPNGERYIFDKFGNKQEVKMLDNGKMYYLDEHGNMVVITDATVEEEPSGWKVFVFFRNWQKSKSNKPLTIPLKNAKTYD